MGPFSKVRKERKRARLGRIYQFCLGCLQFEKEMDGSWIAFPELQRGFRDQLHEEGGARALRKGREKANWSHPRLLILSIPEQVPLS